MDIVFSLRENGACPLCSKDHDCLLKKFMSKSLDEVHPNSNDDFEVVIYRCPNFHAKEES